MSTNRHSLVIAAETEAGRHDGALSLGDLKALRPWRRPLGFDAVQIRAPDRRAFPRPFLTLSCARYLARRQCEIRLPDGASEPVGWLAPFCLGAAWARDRLHRPRLLRQADTIAAEFASPSAVAKPLRSGAALYLRTDPVPLAQFGGNHRHVTGVLNAFAGVWGGTVLLTTLAGSQLPKGVVVRQVLPARRHWDHPEIGRLANGLSEPRALAAAVADQPIAFVYQRNTAFDLCGVRLARHRGVPFVLEYNGPEMWMARHWAGRRLEFESLAERIETANLRAAHLVVVVSDASRAEVVARGADPRRVVVIPNGVDPDSFNPGVSGAAVRGRLGLSDGPVIGFAGSYGPWHGAEILADAFVMLHRQARSSIPPRLLLVGDGPGLGPVRDRLTAAGLGDRVYAVGAVPPSDMPDYLAACDLLVTPQIANPDGTRFFGSPTKLFEYLAMGKPVVASDLEQIGDVMRESGGGLLVPAGDAPALAAALEQLCADESRRRAYGAAGAVWAQNNASWARRVSTMLAALERCCSLH